MTLEQSIIAAAPIGVSEHACPGGWHAVIGKRVNGETLVRYFHQNDHVANAVSLNRRAVEFTQPEPALSPAGGS